MDGYSCSWMDEGRDRQTVKGEDGEGSWKMHKRKNRIPV